MAQSPVATATDPSCIREARGNLALTQAPPHPTLRDPRAVVEPVAALPVAWPPRLGLPVAWPPRLGLPAVLPPRLDLPVVVPPPRLGLPVVVPPRLDLPVVLSRRLGL